LLNSLTALNQREFNETQTLLNSLTALNQREFNESQTLLNSLTALTQTEFNESQTLLNSLTALTQTEFNETQTLLNSLTGIQEDKQNQIITLLHQLTANTDELEFNTDGVETLLNSLTALAEFEFNETRTFLTSEFHSLTALTQTEFNESQTLLNSLTGIQEDKQSQIITLLHQLTANTDSLEINTDGIETLITSSNTFLDSLTSLNQREFNDTQTLLNSLTALQEIKQSQIITLLHQLTANTDELEINLDNLEINTDGVETLLDSLTALQDDKQNQIITLLDILTAKDYAIELNAENFNLPIDSANITFNTLTIETLLSELTSKDYSTGLKQDYIITLLDSLTALTLVEFNETQTFLDSLTSIQEIKQSQIITLLHQLTANTDELEFNLDNLEINTDGVETLLESLTALTQTEFDQTQTLLDSLTSIQTLKQDDIITLLHQLTANTDSLEINTDDVEFLLSSTNVLLHSLTAIDFATASKQNSIITLLDSLTAKQTTINLDVSAINFNTDEIEGLIKTSNTFLDALTAKQTVTDITSLETRLDILTAVDFATSVKQVETNSLLNELTAIQVDKQDRVITLLNQLTANTDEVEFLLSGTNILLNSLTAVDYSTATKQDTIITLLDALTAKETTISLDVSAINLNTDEIESLIQQSNTFLDVLTAKTTVTDVSNIETKLDTLTAVDYATTAKQNSIITLLEVLTANTDSLEINTDELEYLVSTANTRLDTLTAIQSTIPFDIQTANTLLNTLTSVSYATKENQIETITLLHALTAREYQFTVSAQNIDLNVDDVEELVTSSNTLLASLTSLNQREFNETQTLLDTLTSYNIHGTNSSIPLHVTGNVTTTVVNELTAGGVSVSFADTPNIDAFGRLRVAQPKTLLDAKHLSDKLPLVFNEYLTNTATSTFSANDSMVVLTTNNINDIGIRQTKQYFNYQPGKSTLALFTGKLHPYPNIVKRVGLFQGSSTPPHEPTDGMYLEVTNDGPSFNIVKNNSSIRTIPQSAWNFDKLDGTGNSGVVIDLSAAQIFALDYEWLGIGRVRFGFVQSGKLHYAHYENHINQLDRPYITSPNQPVRYEIRQLGNTQGSLHQICSTVITEGGEDNIGTTTAIISDEIANIDTAKHVLVAIRLKDIARNSSAFLKSIEVLNTSTSNPGVFDVLVNPTTYSQPLTWVDIEGTVLQRASITTNITVTGGHSLYKRFVPSGHGNSSTTELLSLLGENAKIGVNIDGASDVVVVVGSAFANNRTVNLISIVNLLSR
jgi:hypothetical protein